MAMTSTNAPRDPPPHLPRALQAWRRLRKAAAAAKAVGEDFWFYRFPPSATTTSSTRATGPRTWAMTRSGPPTSTATGSRSSTSAEARSASSSTSTRRTSRCSTSPRTSSRRPGRRRRSRGSRSWRATLRTCHSPLTPSTDTSPPAASSTGPTCSGESRKPTGSLGSAGPSGCLASSLTCGCCSPLKRITLSGSKPQGSAQEDWTKWYRGVRRHGLIMGCSVTGANCQERKW